MNNSCPCYVLVLYLLYEMYFEKKYLFFLKIFVLFYGNKN